MALKNWLDKWLPGVSKYLNDQYSADELEHITKIEKLNALRNEQLNSCYVEKEHLVQKLEGYKADTIRYMNEIDILSEQVKLLTEKPVDIPSADITYRRPFLVGKDQWAWTTVDVRNFIMPDFLIEKAVEPYIYDGSQNLDTLIPSIYHLAKADYKYGYDDKYGFGEFWMFPFELRAVRDKNLGADCEDWSIWIGSYFEAANIPKDRWLISCGETRDGIGHATIYVKSNVGKWHHLNSTKPDYKYSYVYQFPTNKDSSDSIGIAEDKFWFSYNSWFSISKFESTEAQASFNKELRKDININVKNE